MQVEAGGTPLPAFTQDCPSRTVLDVIASKWTLYVLGLLHLSDRPLRFTELRRHIGGGVSQKSLTQTLRSLERDGLVTRTVYPTVPPRVDYALTELGTQAERLTTAIATWSVENAPLMLAARDAFDHRPDPAGPAYSSITCTAASSADAPAPSTPTSEA